MSEVRLFMVGATLFLGRKEDDSNIIKSPRMLVFVPQGAQLVPLPGNPSEITAHQVNAEYKPEDTNLLNAYSEAVSGIKVVNRPASSVLKVAH